MYFKKKIYIYVWSSIDKSKLLLIITRDYSFLFSLRVNNIDL